MIKMMMAAFNIITKMAEGLITVQDTLLILYYLEDSNEKKELLKEQAEKIKKSKQMIEQSRIE